MKESILGVSAPTAKKKPASKPKITAGKVAGGRKGKIGHPNHIMWYGADAA
jgi:hypothetical protein